MAPGPLGQCHPMPDDEGIRREMINIAASYQKVHDMYNFDYDPQPGTALYEVDQRIKRVSMCACVCVCVCVCARCVGAYMQVRALCHPSPYPHAGTDTPVGI